MILRSVHRARACARAYSTRRLLDALTDVQKHAAPFVNISRLQLAIRGVEQGPGRETIRIAVLNLQGRRAQQLVKLWLADPLSDEQPWERELSDKAVLVRGGATSNQLVQEVCVASPKLRGMEILILNTGSVESALTPTIEIPMSATKFTPIATPVHRAVVVGEGIRGATALMDAQSPDVLAAVEIAVNEETPFQRLRLDEAESGLRAFRESATNAPAFERGWFASGIPQFEEWLKVPDDKMHPAVQRLIESVLESTQGEIEAEKNRRFAQSLSTVSPDELELLQKGLTRWCEMAHNELRDQLDVAFEGSRWRKLGWWKLFWRVDDVTMIATDILSQRFLIDAEKELIYFVGRIDGTGLISSEPELALEVDGPKIIVEQRDTDPIPFKNHEWPIDIHVTRTVLTTESIPALQALAQKLVMQTVSTSSLVSALGGMMYFSAYTGIYEAGAVVALGVVWSLKRMQNKWETAREFWEGEVREEGRKALRTIEGMVRQVIKPAAGRIEGAEELKLAEKAVEEAREALMTDASSQEAEKL